MIECDSCNEWFHGDCIGITKQVGTKLSQYICIGCARVRFNYDPWGNNQNNSAQSTEKDDKTSNPLVEDFNLDIFSTSKRAQYSQLRELIDEGEQHIPIFLEELAELKTIEDKVEMWLDNIQQYLDYYQAGTNNELDNQSKYKIIFNTSYIR